VLDATHKVMLRAVATGSAPESANPPPALRNLEGMGLVVHVDGRWAITETGHFALGPEPEGAMDLRAKLTAWFTT
jgi:hypothetical protein